MAFRVFPILVALLLGLMGPWCPLEAAAQAQECHRSTKSLGRIRINAEVRRDLSFRAQYVESQVTAGQLYFVAAKRISGAPLKIRKVTRRRGLVGHPILVTTRVI
jgi:hypothetical protein